jgi:hypothetical protein
MIPPVRTRPLASGRLPWAKGASRDLPSRRALRPYALWLLVLAAGVGLLALRYDWGPDAGRFAERGFLLSAYLFLILLPTCFYLARWLLRSTRAAAILTGVVFFVTTLPYKALGLDDLYYYRVRPHVFPIDRIRVPSLEFFPGGMLRAFPYDWLFWPLLLAAGVALIWGVWRLRNRGAAASRRLPVLLSVAFAAICLQAALHTSMHAPYTYLSYFQRTEAKQHWYHVYNFRDGTGAVEADDYVFYPLEDYFQGAPRDGQNELIRRPFSFYLASQASYFVNTFYVWLVLNCLFWLIAVIATWRLVGQLATERAGLIAGALTAVGPGFVAFVGTPAMYMQYYAAVAVALCLFEELVVRNRGQSTASVALFTGALTLCALTYDLTPLFLVLLAYGLARSVRPWSLLCSLGVAFVVALGFTSVVTQVLGIVINPQNSEQISDAISGFKSELLHPSLPRWYDDIVSVVPSFIRLVLQAFFVVPVAVALFGIRKLRDKPLQILVGGLFLMSLATVALFQIAEVKYLETLPRLVYPIFPAVYLLAAVALDPGEQPPQRSNPRRREEILGSLRSAAPWIVVGILFVLANIDIFGYPTLYVEFFVSDPPIFLPH